MPIVPKRMAALIAAIATFTPTSPSRAAEPKARPNIVFILADDLGWTDLGCQGTKYYETPNIDRLARDGACGSPTATPAARTASRRAPRCMSGQYGPRTGVYTVGSIDRFDWQSPARCVPVDNVTALPLRRSRSPRR